MALETFPWDAAEYIHGEDELASYLAIVMEADDGPTIYSPSLALAGRVRGGLDVLARETGVSETELRELIAADDEERTLPVLRRVQQAYERLAHTRLVA